MLLSLPLLLTSPTFAAPAACRISEVPVDLELYIRMSQLLAEYGHGSLTFATAPDAILGDDERVEFTLTPSPVEVLTLTVIHHEARPVDDGSVGSVSISDTLVIESDGSVRDQNETRSHSCSVRRAMAEAALMRMREAYGF